MAVGVPSGSGRGTTSPWGFARSPRVLTERHVRQQHPRRGHQGDPASNQSVVPVGEKINSVKTAWAGTCRRAGISGLQIRDVRREFASRLRESGGSDHDVRDFLGHAKITTTSRYLASTPLRLEQALANLEAGNRRTSVAQKADSAGHESESLDPEHVDKSFKL